MELPELNGMVHAYQESLKAEYFAKIELLDRQNEAKAIEAEIVAAGYADGVIDGKNAETRKAQCDALLLESEALVKQTADLRLVENAAALAEISRKGHDARIGLVKAWLYSQSKVG